MNCCAECGYILEQTTVLGVLKSILNTKKCYKQLKEPVKLLCKEIYLELKLTYNTETRNVSVGVTEEKKRGYFSHQIIQKNHCQNQIEGRITSEIC